MGLSRAGMGLSRSVTNGLSGVEAGVVGLAGAAAGTGVDLP